MAASAEPTAPFRPLEKSGEDWSAMFCGSAQDKLKRITSSGHITTSSGSPVSLALRKTEVLQWVWVQEVDGQLLVAYEVTDRTADGSSGGVCRLNAPVSRRLWCTRFPAFNVVPAMGKSGQIYLSGIGTVAELDARSGRYRWKVSGLYEKSSAFNAFLTPVDTGDNVTFYATAGTQGSPVWSVQVDRKRMRATSVQATAGAPPEALEIRRTAGTCSQ